MILLLRKLSADQGHVYAVWSEDMTLQWMKKKKTNVIGTVD